ncbi:GntR family transcriptional regulator [Mycoplasmoides genitalium]
MKFGKEMAKKNQIIYRYIILKIQSFEWPANTRIFSERQLEIRFNSSRSQIRSVLATLLNKNIIRYTKNTPGYFVCKDVGFSFFHKTQDNLKVKYAKLSTLIKKLLSQDDASVFANIDSTVHLDKFKGIEAKFFDENKKHFLNVCFFAKDDILNILDENNLQQQFFREFAYNGIAIEKRYCVTSVDKESGCLVMYDMYYDDNDNFVVASKSNFLNPELKVINA